MPTLFVAVNWVNLITAPVVGCSRNPAYCRLSFNSNINSPALRSRPSTSEVKFYEIEHCLRFADLVSGFQLLVVGVCSSLQLERSIFDICTNAHRLSLLLGCRTCSNVQMGIWLYPRIVFCIIVTSMKASFQIADHTVVHNNIEFICYFCACTES